jgi:hypothetical protein
MRLPQSINQSLSVRTVHLLTPGMAILLLAFMPVAASAAASQLTCTPAKLGFGAVVVGQTQALLVTVTNTGQTTVTVSGITVGNPALTASYVNLPLALLAGQSVNLSVSFTPMTTGWTGGTITFTTNASNSTLQLEAGGTGVSGQSITASPSTVSFGQVAIGTVSTTPVVLTNARSWKVTISAVHVTGSGFSVSGATFPLTLGAGQSVTLNVAFAPQSAGSSGGRLLVAGPQLVIPLTGTGTPPGQLTANPASLTFGSVQVGGNLTLSDSLTNTGGSSVTISQAIVTGAGFSISGLDLPLTLNPGASVTFSAVFAPQSAGNLCGTITLKSNASNSTSTVALSGTGIAQGQLTLTPTSLNFGSATVGTTVSQTSSLSASGTSVTVSSASLGSGEFSLSGISIPLTIAPGQSVPFTLTFSPQATGAASATLSVTSNASNTPTETVNGVGTAPPQHSVALFWTDTASWVVGYNIYRGAAVGGPFTKINSALDSTPAYTDSSILAGQTYYYLATAVDGSGAESAYSNEVQAVIPTP